MRSLIALTATAVLAIAEATFQVAPIFEYRGPPAPLSNDGVVIDTPEVARARAAHLAVHAAAVARLKKVQNELEETTTKMTPMMPMMSTMSTAPEMPMMPAMPAMAKMTKMQMTTAEPEREEETSAAPIGPDGRVVDTPEVAQAKAAHLAAHARATAKASARLEFEVLNGHKNLIYLTPVAPIRVTYTHISPLGYNGPPAPLGPDGRVIDTPEVAKARDAHMKAYARAIALTASDNNLD